MSEHDPSTGARRRQRAAEQEERLAAAERGGLARPLTRRELRRRELEEQARLEAIATGELPLLGEDGMPADTGDVAARLDAAGTGREVGGGATAQDMGAAGLSDEAPEASGRRRAPNEPAAREHAPNDEAAPQQEPSDGAAPPVPARRPIAARRPVVPAPSSSYATTPSSPAEAIRSRRSIRDRLGSADDLDVAENAVPAQADERTTTTRRPVVRPPHTARGIRRLDETGTLTGVQPVAAPAPTPAPAGPSDAETDATTDPAGWESAVALPLTHDGHLTGPDADEPASAASPEAGELVAPSARASAADGVTADGHPATGAAEVPDEEWSDGAEPDDGVLLESGNPAASLVKIIALVLAAIVIGLLIGLLWFNNNNDDGRAESGGEARVHNSAGASLSGNST